MSPRRRNNDRKLSGQRSRGAQVSRRSTQNSQPPANPRIPKTIDPSTPSRVGVASVRRSWGTDGSIAVSQFAGKLAHPVHRIWLGIVRFIVGRFRSIGHDVTPSIDSTRQRTIAKSIDGNKRDMLVSHTIGQPIYPDGKPRILQEV